MMRIHSINRQYSSINAHLAVTAAHQRSHVGDVLACVCTVVPSQCIHRLAGLETGFGLSCETGLIDGQIHSLKLHREQGEEGDFR